MAEFNTFLKLHRSILDSAVFSDAETLRVWIYILCKAAIQDRQILINGCVVDLKKGQLVTGRKKMAEQLKMTETRVYRALKLLEELGNVHIKPHNKFSLVTVANWAKFQDGSSNFHSKPTANSQQTHSKLTTNPQQTHTNKELKEIYNYKNYRIEEDAPSSFEKQKIKSFLDEQCAGVVKLTDDQIDLLLEKMDVDTALKYIAVVNGCELDGKKYKKKSHYKAVVDMAEKDNETGRKKKPNKKNESAGEFTMSEEQIAALKRAQNLLEKWADE